MLKIVQSDTLDRLRNRVETKATRSYHRRVEADLDLMEVVTEVERTQFYLADGYQSTAEWLCNFLGTGFCRAGEFVQVALALEELPQLKQAFKEGRISFDHLRALISVANADNESDLLASTEGLPVGDTFKLVKRIRKVSEDDSRFARKGRYLEMRWDHENGVLLLFAVLPEEQGAIVEKAINLKAKKIPDDPDDEGGKTPMAVKRADALVELASGSENEHAQAARITVHIGPQALMAGGTVASIEDGPQISEATAAKLTCDSSVEIITHDEVGTPLNKGRSRRTVDPAQYRQLKERDGHCRWGGCRRRTNLIAHHILEWATQDGPTDLDKLVLFCRPHHDMLHANKWKVVGTPPKISIERSNLPRIQPGPPRLNQATIKAFELIGSSPFDWATAPDT